MALSFKLNGNVLEVQEKLVSYNSTRIQYWYYDIKDWLVSSNGKQGETPTRPMMQSSIDWVKKYYIPKVKG